MFSRSINKIKIKETVKGARAYYYSLSRLRWFPLSIFDIERIVKERPNIKITVESLQKPIANFEN